MNTLRLFLALLFVSNSIQGQQTLNQNLITFPLAPETARFQNFGNVPVNLFTGQLEQGVDLFTGSVGNFVVPINLSYNYAGCRVEEAPSIIGLGWQLTSGGAVSREVRGFPDEHPAGYLSPGCQSILSNYFNTGSMVAHDYQKIDFGLLDSEADKYSLNVNGIAFSFKIGTDGLPHYLSKHDYKLEIVRSQPNSLNILSFVLTDTSGNRYYFEDRETNRRIAGADHIFEDNFQSYVSSWQLTKIIANNNAIINFGYANDNYSSFNFYASGVYRGISIGQSQNSYSSGATEDLIERKILTSISADTFSAIFTIGQQQGQDVYTKIRIKSKRNIVNDATDMVYEYDFIYAGQRNCLTRINKNSEFLYEFGYFGGTSMIPFIDSITDNPWGQDEWGFSNGVNNSYGVNIPWTEYIANKAPSFSHTAAGALRSIKYPTGGTTEIFYEQNTSNASTAGDENQNPNVRIHLEFETDNTPTAPATKQWTFTKTFDSNVAATLTHTLKKVSGSIQLTITRTPVCSPYVVYPTIFTGQYYNQIPQMRSLMNDPNPALCLYLNETINDGCTTSNCTFTHDSGGKFILYPGTYAFTFSTDLNNYEASGELTLDFHDASLTDEFTAYYKPVGGIRVLKTIDHPVTGEDVTKYYRYEAGSEFIFPVQKIPFRETYGFFNVIPDIPNTWEFSSRSFNQVLSSNIPIYYGSVIVAEAIEEVFVPKKLLCTTCSSSGSSGTYRYTFIGGQYGTTKIKYPKGYTRTTFENPRNLLNDYPFAPYGRDLSMGTVSLNEVFSATAADYSHKKLVEEQNTNTYSDYTRWANIYGDPNYPKSLKLIVKCKRFGLAGPGPIPPNLTINDFYSFETYKELDSQTYPYIKKTKEFFDDVTMEKITTTMINSHEKAKTVTTTESDGQQAVSELFYPYDFTDAISTDMVAKNVLDPVVKVINKKNNEVLDTNHFEYYQLGSYLFGPGTLLNSKGNQGLEQRLKYTYDNTGNIINKRTLTNSAIPYSLNDPNTTIIWGYKKSAIIAKIESGSVINVPATTITQLQSLSDSGTEASLITALNDLRVAFPDALVTTYTHKPLIGVSTITDPKGDKVSYTYDNQGRLISVRDKDNNILSQNEYHYKP